MIVIPKVSLATSSDARGIALLSRDHIEQGLMWSWTQPRVQRAIADRATNVVVMREQGYVLGFGIMRYGETRAHLDLLGVLAPRQNRGLGSALLAWLEKCAATAGIERIRVETRADNPRALGFYFKHGYARLDSTPGYYQGVIDAERLEKILLRRPPRPPER